MSRLVVVANRLPVRHVEKDGQARWVTSPGGLVSALQPPLQARDGAWIGWSGVSGPVREPFQHDGIENRVVALSREEMQSFYEGFSNSTLWPLYHDAVRTPEFRRRWWKPYVEINQRYADAAAAALSADDVAWVQDYQLQLVPRMLRAVRPELRIGFFMHIPFPPAGLFAQLPWRRQILEGLLGADQLGFQTPDGAQNFLHSVSRYTEYEVEENHVRVGDRRVLADCFPISIDTARYEDLAASARVQERARDIREAFGPERRILLGVDRLDYTKGIDVRLTAFENLLERNPDFARRCVFIQVAVPSRETVDSYASMREDIEQRVGRINGRYGEAGMVPLHYHYRNLPIEELVAYYVAADVMVVTPMRDGMNLVCKEYVAARVDDTGLLVLSEFAGAAEELRSALLVNPHDIDGIVATLERALAMPADEARARMTELRRVVRSNDVHHWAERFLESLQR